MTERVIALLVVLSALGAALVGGVFFAFSTFVMAALGRIAPDSGMAAMQAINVTVITPSFMLALFGTGLALIVLGFDALFGWSGVASRGPVLGAAALYLLGCLGVTMILNVPLNDALAPLAPASPEATALWSRYLAEWTLYNHWRTAASLGAATLLILSLL